MHERKLIQVGNSVGVTLPPEITETLGLRVGDWLELHIKDEWLMIAKSDIQARTEEHRDEVRRQRRTLRKK